MNNHNPQQNQHHNNAPVNDMYKQNGGLGVNSIKHPGPPALANWSLSNAQNILNSNNNINGYYNNNNEYNSNPNPSFNVGNYNNNTLNRPNNGSSNTNYLNNVGNGSVPFISAAPMLLSGNSNNNHNYNSYKPPIYQSFQPSFNLGSIAKPQIPPYQQQGTHFAHLSV